ncbi:MAG: hypothetical protein IJS29_00785 [Selenomonadaceae bacterium]|nr:hypothetical protein [Selenomonadaceae bacterium]
MEVIIKGDAKEIAELLATTIRHNEKEVFNFGGITVKDPEKLNELVENVNHLVDVLLSEKKEAANQRQLSLLREAFDDFLGEARR